MNLSGLYVPSIKLLLNLVRFGNKFASYLWIDAFQSTPILHLWNDWYRIFISVIFSYKFCCILSNSTRLQPSDVSVGIMHIIYPFGTDKVSFVRYTQHQPFCISFKSWTHIVVGIRRVVVVRIAIVVAIAEIRRRGYQTLPDVNIYFPFSIFLRSLLSLCLHPFNRSTSLSTASRSGINLFKSIAKQDAIYCNSWYKL